MQATEAKYWPICCGETMTIDAPNEREASDDG